MVVNFVGEHLRTIFVEQNLERGIVLSPVYGEFSFQFSGEAFFWGISARFYFLFSFGILKEKRKYENWDMRESRIIFLCSKIIKLAITFSFCLFALPFCMIFNFPILKFVSVMLFQTIFKRTFSSISFRSMSFKPR